MQNDKVQYCSKYHAACYQDNGDFRRYVAFPMRCKSWDCPDCRRVKAKNYRKRISALFDGRKLFFYTLTYYHSMTPEVAWSTYNNAWNRLRTNLRKQYGRFEYVRVLESHNKSPYPHLHIITDRWFPEHKFGYSAIAAGFGYQIAAKPITGNGAAAYITKYLTKEWTNELAWSYRKTYRCRIISFSSGILSPKISSGDWRIITCALGLGSVIESIRADYLWRSDIDARVMHERINDSSAEISVVFRSICPGHNDVSG